MIPGLSNMRCLGKTQPHLFYFLSLVLNKYIWEGKLRWSHVYRPDLISLCTYLCLCLCLCDLVQRLRLGTGGRLKKSLKALYQS